MFRIYSVMLGVAAIAWGVRAADVQTNAPAKVETESNRKENQAEAALGTNTLSALDRWSFQAGVAFITGSTIDEIIQGKVELGDAEDGAGQIYLLQASYKLSRFNPTIFGEPIALDLELPMVLGVVDEEAEGAFMQYSAGLTLRLKTFPWNRWLYTNLESGVGLTYSQYVLRTERARHPDRERSHMEFYWPVQLMLALPDHRQHQLVLFLHHHSGGTLFHKGGANSLGFGYRYVPGERR